MADNLVYAYRSADGLFLKRGLKNVEDILVKRLNPQTHTCRSFQFSNSGRYFTYCDSERTVCVETATGKEVYSDDLGKTLKIMFSPSDRIMVTWEPFVIYGLRTNDDGTKRTPNPNLRFVSMDDMKQLAILSSSKQTSWRPQFSDDEKFCVVLTSGSELHFFENGQFDRFTRKGVIKDLELFELSPGLDPVLACFIPAKSGKPGLIQLRSSHDDLKVISQKTSFNCDTCALQWNSKGNAVLATTTVEVDQSNQSYYGVSFVYLLTKTGDSYSVQLSKQGPLHSMQWSPTGNNFAVCFGFMPAKLAVFNLHASVIWDLGESHRNELYYNNFGNLLITCGFGNIAAGKMQVWDIERRSQVIEMEVPSTTFFQWAPDGQHFVTATTAPRLRIDNNYRIWHYTGDLLTEFHSTSSEGKGVELWQIAFKPAPGLFNKFKVVELTDADKKRMASMRAHSAAMEMGVNKLKQVGIVSAAGKYVPPHQRKGAQNADSTGNNKKKNNNGGNNVSATPRPEVTPEQKKISGLKKKVDDIKKLKIRYEKGEPMEKNQLDKMNKLESLEQELAQLTCES